MENIAKLTTREAALEFVDTVIRKKWDTEIQTNPLLSTTVLGQASIVEEVNVTDHQAWQYTIEGLPVSRDARKRWVLDTGDMIDTTLSDDADTLEKAIAKQRHVK